MNTLELAQLSEQATILAEENGIQIFEGSIDSDYELTYFNFTSNKKEDLNRFFKLLKNNGIQILVIEQDFVTEEQFNNAIRLTSEDSEYKEKLTLYFPFFSQLAFLSFSAISNNKCEKYILAFRTDLNDLINEVVETFVEEDTEEDTEEEEEGKDTHGQFDNDEFESELDSNDLKFSLSIKLFNTIKDENIELIKSLINQGADVNFRDPYTRNSLISCYFDKKGIHKRNYRINTNINLDFLKKLTSLGFDIEQGDKDGLTPLKQAIKYNGSQNLIKCLIDCGANINAIGKNSKRVPLDYIDYRSTSPEEKNDLKEMLIKAGAKLDIAQDRALIEHKLQLRSFR